MDLALLTVFKAVAEEGGINAAARKLHRVQSNVTARVQQLEASLGTPLFVRTKGRLHLSPAGEVFLRYADRLLALSEEARAAMQADAPRGVLRIGTLESTAGSRLPPLLARFHRRHPEVRVELSTGTTDALVDAVRERRIEAAFVADCVSSRAIEQMPAFVEELAVIAPASHPAIARPQDVRADTIVAFPNGCAYRRRLQAWLAAGGVMPARVLELASYHAIVACVAAGTGIAIVPRSVLDTLRRHEGVKTHALGRNRSRAVTSLMWRAGETSAPLAALKAALGSWSDAASIDGPRGSLHPAGVR